MADTENSPFLVTYFPLTVFEQIYGMSADPYYQIYLLAEQDADTAAVTAQVVDLLEKRHQCYGATIRAIKNAPAIPPAIPISPPIIVIIADSDKNCSSMERVLAPKALRLK